METRNYIISLAVAAFIFFGALGVLFWYGGTGESSPEPRPRQEQKLEDSEMGGVEVDESISPGPEIKILPETEIEAGPAVRHRDGGFKPQEILLKDEGAGCILTIHNDDKEEILVRLSPHSASGDSGFSYDPIPAGSLLRLDPRYSGFSEAKFHNHLEPEAEFIVRFDKTCQ